MQRDRWTQVKRVFDAAVGRTNDERNAYVIASTGGDVELIGEVNALLAAFDAADGFMEKPLAGRIAERFVQREADDLQPGRVFTHYKIGRQIGTGGSGNVYLAEDTQLKRSVAIKVLTAAASLDAEQSARFIQEARLASLLNHPNILTIYEIGHVENICFISSEFVSGETLRTRLLREAIPTKQSLDIAIDMASALVVAHGGGVVHRDIKPENIMLRDDGLLKVVDFGLAKLSATERPIEDTDATWSDVTTSPGMILGTVAYMSPEQASGSEADERTDIWSLGVVLYEMIGGHAPFSGVSPAHVVESILHTQPNPINHASADVQRGMRRILKNALAKRPGDRYRNMHDMLDDLKALRMELETGIVEPYRLAILPFTNITGDARFGFFEFALADAVITELGRSHSLVVRPSASVAKYLGKTLDPLEVGRELKVDAVLTANFLASKKRIRVTAQLVGVVDKNVLWAEQIDADTEDIISLQDTITHRIVEGLQCELDTTSEECTLLQATGSSLAYVEYLQGRDQLRRYMFHTVANENVDIAIRHFQRALELDPNFALAHSALGICHLQRVLKIVGSRQDLEAAMVSLDRALELEPRLIDARAYRAFIMRLQGETDRSRDEMAELRRESPNNFEVQYLSAACYRFDGDYESALQCYDEMLRIDPTAEVSVHYCRARIFWYRGRFDLSFEELRRARQIEPNHPIVRFFHAIVTFRSGEPEIAAEQLRNLFATYTCEGFRPYLAICLSAMGDHAAARLELTRESEKIAEVDPDVSYWMATAHLMAGRTDDAFKWLERSIFLGNQNLAWFESDPIWEPVHADPRYIRLMSGMKHSYD